MAEANVPSRLDKPSSAPAAASGEPVRLSTSPDSLFAQSRLGSLASAGVVDEIREAAVLEVVDIIEPPSSQVAQTAIAEESNPDGLNLDDWDAEDESASRTVPQSR